MFESILSECWMSPWHLLCFGIIEADMYVFFTRIHSTVCNHTPIINDPEEMLLRKEKPYEGFSLWCDSYIYKYTIISISGRVKNRQRFYPSLRSLRRDAEIVTCHESKLWWIIVKKWKIWVRRRLESVDKLENLFLHVFEKPNDAFLENLRL